MYVCSTLYPEKKSMNYDGMQYSFYDIAYITKSIQNLYKLIHLP